MKIRALIFFYPFNGNVLKIFQLFKGCKFTFSPFPLTAYILFQIESIFSIPCSVQLGDINSKLGAFIKSNFHRTHSINDFAIDF